MGVCFGGGSGANWGVGCGVAWAGGLGGSGLCQGYAGMEGEVQVQTQGEIGDWVVLGATGSVGAAKAREK